VAPSRQTNLLVGSDVDELRQPNDCARSHALVRMLHPSSRLVYIVPISRKIERFAMDIPL